MSNQKGKSESVIIGSYWNKTGEKGNSYQSVAMTGKRPEDEFEVVLRRKSDQAEMSLSQGVNIVIRQSSKKTKPTSPDGIIAVYFNE